MSAMKRLVLASLLCVALTACPTGFQGDAHYPGGPAACRSDCEAQGLEMSAFVYSGEFATSCVCRLRRDAAPAPGPATPSAPDPQAGIDPSADGDADAADVGAMVGVVLQARRAAEEQAARNRQASVRPDSARPIR
jgi:hypothetical protein